MLAYKHLESDMDQHAWIIEVLVDIREYARMNGLADVSSSVGSTLELVATQLETGKANGGMEAVEKLGPNAPRPSQSPRSSFLES